MQKTISLALCITLLTGMHFINADMETGDTFKLLAGLVGVAGIGYLDSNVREMNKEYAKHNRRPDWTMRGYKALAAATGLFVYDLLKEGGVKNLNRNLLKIALFSTSLAAFSDTAADIIRPIPFVGAILTDERESEGEKDFGAVARFLWVYITGRELVVDRLIPYVK